VTGRQALGRLATGTAVIARGLRAGEWRETLARLVIAAVVATLGYSAVALHPWLAPVAALLWAGAANAAAPPEPEEDSEDGDEEETLDPEVFLELLHDLSRGGNVHLSAVRAQLAEEVPGVDWHGPAVAALCEAAGVRVRRGVRVPGATPAVTTGIHHADLPPLPHPTSGTPVGVVVAGQRDNNNTNTLITERIGEGGLIIKNGPSTRQGVRRRSPA